MTEDETLGLLEKLRLYARKWRFNEEDSLDLASSAYVRAFEQGVVTWAFAGSCLHNLMLAERRNRKRRNLDYRWTYIGDSSEPEEMKKLSTQPNQIERMDALACLADINAMSDEYRAVMLLTAQEWTMPEISAALDMPIEEVRWRIGRARFLLRKSTDRGEKAKPKFTGVRKVRHKWWFAIRKDGKFYHCGSHATAENAARAYDAKAREFGLSEDQLNFPIAA